MDEKRKNIYLVDKIAQKAFLPYAYSIRLIVYAVYRNVKSSGTVLHLEPLYCFWNGGIYILAIFGFYGSGKLVISRCLLLFNNYDYENRLWRFGTEHVTPRKIRKVDILNIFRRKISA